MLDFFAILSKSGIVLFLLQNSRRNPVNYVNNLVSDVFLEERTFLGKHTYDNIQMEYVVNNQLDTIYIAGYYRVFSLPYIKNVLSDVDKVFHEKYSFCLQNGIEDILNTKFEFSNEFNVILKTYESKSNSKSPNDVLLSKKDHGESRVTVPTDLNEEVVIDKAPVSPDTASIDNNQEVAIDKVLESPTVSKNGENINEMQVPSIGKVNLMKKARKNEKLKKGVNSKRKLNEQKTDTTTNLKSKTPRKWGNSNNTNGSGKLDFSEEVVSQTNINVPSEYKINTDNNTDLYESVMKNANSKVKEEKKTGIFSYFSNLVGSKKTSKQSLEPIMKNIKEHLCGKNVAVDIAENICNSVSYQLEGKTLGTFESLKSTVNTAIMDAIKKILITTKDVNLPSEIMKINRENRRPYVIVFCGVNGVGKSTNLAKIAHLLSTKFDLKILIAACDTFRSGAVEQLRTHVSRLNHVMSTIKNASVEYVTLYDRGYNKDAALVAKEAIAYGKKSGNNVVLIDTAGRMQDNEPLMRSLSKLININSPDLVLFVGEALVGNDGIDQLRKFNSSLNNQSFGSNPHLIDGTILTKFDTVDDKVGAAISMVYETKKPIVFVGTGQTYADLKTMDTSSVVKLLFS